MVFLLNLPFNYRLQKLKIKHGGNLKEVSPEELSEGLGSAFSSIDEYTAAIIHLCGEIGEVSKFLKVETNHLILSQVVGFKIHGKYLEPEYEEALDKVLRAENSREEILKTVIEFDDWREETINFLRDRKEFSQWISEGKRLYEPFVSVM